MFSTKTLFLKHNTAVKVLVSFFLFFFRAHLKGGVAERGVFEFACQYIVSLRGRTGNRTVTQMRDPSLVEGRPKCVCVCVRQSLASTLSVPRVAATSYCDPGRHSHGITPCLLAPCLNKCAQFFLWQNPAFKT